MKGFVQELSDREVLSAKDILKLKNYIAEKYKYSSSGEKAQILANAVHRVVDMSMPEIEADYRLSVRQKLIDKTIKSEEHTISLYDIFDCCLSLEVKPKDLMSGLVNWININVDNKITDYEIHQYNNEIQNIEPSIVALNDFKETEQVEGRYNIYKLSKLLNYKYVICLMAVIVIVVFNFILFNSQYLKVRTRGNIKTNPLLGQYLKRGNISTSNKAQTNIANFEFKNVNKPVLKRYLLTKKSLLGLEPYFSTIISVAKEYNINPLVLFAIAGQEQGFVPQFHSTSRSIVNNPFNVYHSWKEYNTSISDATKIVCVTIKNLSKNRPSNVEPFTWINRKYAQDQNWARGVNLIYNKLEKINNQVAK